MRAEFYLVLSLLAWIRQASTTPNFISAVEPEQPDKRKLSTQQLVNYNPNSRIAVLNINNLDRTVLNSGLTLHRHSRRSVNNFNVEVLRWLTNITDCSAIGKCSESPAEEDATVVQSHRICWTWVDSTTAIHCDETIPAGSTRALVLLEHIYTGCYCFRLSLYKDDSIRTASQLLDQPLYLHTDVVEYDVFKWNLSLDLSVTIQNDLNLLIKLDEANATDFHSYHIELFRYDDKDEDLMVCLETDDPINKHFTIAKENFNIDLAAQEWQMIQFQNLSHGYYCVVVIPEDDRCHPPLFDPDKTCARHSNIVQLRDVESMVLTYYSGMGVSVYWIAGAAILLMICALIGFLLKRKMNPVLFIENFYGVLDNPLKEGEENVTQSPEIPILFLYSSRSIERLSHHVSHLKKVIRNDVPNSRVWDNTDDEDLAVVEGIEWFTNHLQGTNNIRIVIFMCPEMIRCQEWFLRSKNEADYQDGNVDQACCYRLNQLFHHIDGNNVYRQVFAIHFDDDLNVGNRSSFCLLTPYRSYRWHHDEIALLTALGRREY